MIKGDGLHVEPARPRDCELLPGTPNTILPRSRYGKDDESVQQ